MRAGENVTDSASSTQHMPDPYELAQERRRRREADEATADVLVGLQGERVPITAWVDSYYWSCQVCGWLGKGYTSIEGAMNGSRLHIKADHPDMEQAKVLRKDTDV